MPSAKGPATLVVGAGAIGGVIAAGLVGAGHSIVTLTTNAAIAASLRERGYELVGHRPIAAPNGSVLTAPPSSGERFDFVFLAVQPPQVEAAAQSVAAHLESDGKMVCFQNGLCEERVAKIVGRERVLGAVVAWGASMVGPGRYERTSRGGFTVGKLDGSPDASARAVATMLSGIGPVALTDNLLGARWSKLAINCAISTLGTIGGDRVGVLMRRRHVRRLALEIMTETVRVARAGRIRLEKVAGTVDLEWLALPDGGRWGPGAAARHAVLLSAGLKYRKLRSSMLAAIERGRTPAVDFLNGEIVDRAEVFGFDTPVNRAATEYVWQIAEGERRASRESLWELYEKTR